MGRTQKRRMIPAEFQACMPLVRQLSADRVDAARAVLVDGEAGTKVAARYGWSRQAVNECVDKLWDALQTYNEAKRNEAQLVDASLPPGWQRVTIAAPTKLIDQFREQLEDLDQASAGRVSSSPRA